jgi:hypothetical protein
MLRQKSWNAERTYAARWPPSYLFRSRLYVTERPRRPALNLQLRRTSMPAEWEQLYREAFQELDAEKVPELCDRARHAINDRLMELAAQAIAAGKEREQLFEALRALVIHEYKRRAPN